MRRLCLLMLVAACGPPSGPADVAVLHYDPHTDTYEMGVERLSTLDDLASLSGLAGQAVGSARIEFAPLADPADQVRLLDPGGVVSAHFVEKDGAYWPTDFYSLDLATTYFNLERSRAYARQRGLGDQLDHIRFFYLPQLTVAGQVGVWADNAAFVSSLAAFVLPPFDRLREIPLSMNQGVIAHEYGHALFSALVHRGAAFPDTTSRWCPDDLCAAPQGFVMMGAVEEGFADAWALGVTGDTRFLERSIPQLGSARAVTPFSKPAHCFSQARLTQEIDDVGLSVTYWAERQYVYGTGWAGALWSAGQQPGTDLDRVMDALLGSYDELGERLRADVDGGWFGSYANLTDLVASHAPDAGTREAICAVLLDRFDLAAASAPTCAGVTRLAECR